MAFFNRRKSPVEHIEIEKMLNENGFCCVGFLESVKIRSRNIFDRHDVNLNDVVEDDDNSYDVEVWEYIWTISSGYGKN